ncbi:MAG: GNAT family N-acetyltransferase [Thermodesulfobacteriota bacterium]
MENIIIRRLKVEDVEDIGGIQERITKTPVTQDFLKIIREDAQKPDNACFVAEHNGTIVGFMVSSILSGIFGVEQSAWISILGVDPKYMGQEIGRALASEILSFYQSRGIKSIYTSVRWDSTDLLSFFKTLGFDRSNFINLKRALD